MKRIVQCPKCQTKLSVLDLGKPIKQKCPKCKETFDIESEEGKSAVTKKEPTADAAPVAEGANSKPEVKADAHVGDKTNAETKAETKPDTKPEAKPDAKPEAKSDTKPEAKPDAKPESKEAAAPKPVAKAAAPKPAAAPVPQPEVHQHHGGLSFQHILVVIVLLICVLLLQFKTMYYDANRFNELTTQISDMQKALSDQIHKSR